MAGWIWISTGPIRRPAHSRRTQLVHCPRRRTSCRSRLRPAKSVTRVLTEQAAPENAGKRLDTYLQERLPQFSRSRLQSWINSGNVQVNSALAKPSYVLRGNERITVEPAGLPPLQAQPEDLPLQIVYE